MKLQFSGHDSFVCKHFWLKKGYDFIINNGRFGDEAAVIELGVGKNMVTAISYWLKSFGIINTHTETTDLANYLFHEETGIDPYIENIASVWLLHYYLIKTNKASIYNLFFNDFRKGRPAFTKNQLLSFIKTKFEESDQKNFNETTVATDIAVLIRSYLSPIHKDTKIDIEEEFSGLLIDLDIMKSITREDIEKKNSDYFLVESSPQETLPAEVVLFTILDNQTYGNAVSLKELHTGTNSPGVIFALTEEGLYKKLESIQKKFKGVTYSESAGIQELQFKSKPQKWNILNGCY